MACATDLDDKAVLEKHYTESPWKNPKHEQLTKLVVGGS